MKVKWNDTNITDFIPTVNWGGSDGQAARTLEITTLNSPNDNSIDDLKIRLGDRMKLYNDNNKLLIDAMVYYRERNSETGTVTYSGYDELNHFLRGNVTKNFKNVTPEKITEMLCNELKVEMGSIEKTGINIKSLLIDSESAYDAIMKAYTKAYRANGKKYMPIMNGKKLYIIEKGAFIADFVLSDGVNITSSTYSESLEQMVNRVKIYDDNGKIIGEVKNDGWINSYGIFQEVYTKEEGINATIAANKLLTGIDKSASIEALGNTDCISGYGIKIKDKITGLTGVFWIESDTHTWENGIHTMSLDLQFKNIMDIKE